MDHSSAIEGRRRDRLEKKGRSMTIRFSRPGLLGLVIPHYIANVAVPRAPLSNTLRIKATRLWRYVALVKGRPLATRSEWMLQFETDLNPEAQLFYWETVVLCCVDYVQLTRCLSSSSSVWSLRKPLNTWLEPDTVMAAMRKTAEVPLTNVEDLDRDTTFSSWQRQQRTLREDVFQAVYAVVSGMPDRGERHNDLLFRKVVVSLLRMTVKRLEEFSTLNKVAYERFGEHFGAMCARCGVISQDCKMCQRCHSTFYCSKSCQKSHWHVHKRDCAAST